MGDRKKREPRKKNQAPAWMVTYSDIVTLLLTFFVLLLAQAKIIEIDAARMEDFTNQQRRGEQNPSSNIKHPKQSDLNQQLSVWKDKLEKGGALQKGEDGIEIMIRKRRRGTEVSIGGAAVFEPGSWSLSEDGAEIIYSLGLTIRNIPNTLELIGHTMDAREDSVIIENAAAGTGARRIVRFDKTNEAHDGRSNWYLLGLLRARTIKQNLVGDDPNRPIVDPVRIRLVSRGPFDNLVPHSKRDLSALNRRISLLVTEEIQ